MNRYYSQKDSLIDALRTRKTPIRPLSPLPIRNVHIGESRWFESSLLIEVNRCIILINRCPSRKRAIFLFTIFHVRFCDIWNVQPVQTAITLASWQRRQPLEASGIRKRKFDRSTSLREEIINESTTGRVNLQSHFKFLPTASTFLSFHSSVTVW